MPLYIDLWIFRSSAQERRTMPFPMFLAGISGWTNLLVLLYLPFSFSERFFKFRFSCTLAILLCLGATFVLFITSPFIPLVGCFGWLSGILLVIFPITELL